MFSWCITQLISWLHFQWPDLFLSANCSRLNSKQGNTNLLGHVPNTGLLCVHWPHQSSVMNMYMCECVCVCVCMCMRAWMGVCICTSIPCELSPYPIDDSHMTILYKAASPLNWNTCSAIQHVLFYNSSKNKSVLQHYCFQAGGNDRDEEVFYGDFMGVVFMENLVIIDIIKVLILTLSPDLMWPRASVAKAEFENCFIKHTWLNLKINFKFDANTNSLCLLLINIFIN